MLSQQRIDERVAECKHIEDTVGRYYRKDDPTGLFAQQLVRQTFKELFRFEYPETKWMNGGLITKDTSINEGALSYAYTEIEQQGEAEIISGNATDVPMADISGRNNVLSIQTYGIACKYSRQDIRTARFNGTLDIVQEKVASAREGHDRRLNRDILNGVPAHGLRGVINQPGIIVQAAPNGSWTESTLVEDIVEDVRTAVNFVFVDSQGIETVDTAVFGLTPWTILNRRLDTGTDVTILSVLKTAFPQIRRWDYDPGLETAGPGGTPTAVYYKNDRSRMRAVFPMMMTPTPPEQRGFGFVINFESRFGGVMTPKPRSVLNQTGL
jgi:hypothetical protein